VWPAGAARTVRSAEAARTVGNPWFLRSLTTGQGVARRLGSRLCPLLAVGTIRAFILLLILSWLLILDRCFFRGRLGPVLDFPVAWQALEMHSDGLAGMGIREDVPSQRHNDHQV
jgi:hypothetical protein